MNATISITDRQVADLLCSAFEGGSNYWITAMTIRKGKHDGRPWGDEYTPTYIAAPFSTGGAVEIDPGEGDPIVTLDLAALQRGVFVMANRWPQHFANALSESNADAETGDVFLQCCLFGDIIYG